MTRSDKLEWVAEAKRQGKKFIVILYNLETKMYCCALTNNPKSNMHPSSYSKHKVVPLEKITVADYTNPVFESSSAAYSIPGIDRSLV